MKRVAFWTGAIVMAIGLAGLAAARVKRPRELGPWILSGHYAFGFHGRVLAAGTLPGPIAGSGLLELNGRGGLSGSESFNAGGTVCWGTIAGTYVVHAQGTCELHLSFSPKMGPCPSEKFNTEGAIFASGRGIEFSSTDNIRVVIGEAQK